LIWPDWPKEIILRYAEARLNQPRLIFELGLGDSRPDYRLNPPSICLIFKAIEPMLVGEEIDSDSAIVTLIKHSSSRETVELSPRNRQRI
jgi:hypothetical protein